MFFLQLSRKNKESQCSVSVIGFVRTRHPQHWTIQPQRRNPSDTSLPVVVWILSFSCQCQSWVQTQWLNPLFATGCILKACVVNATPPFAHSHPSNLNSMHLLSCSQLSKLRKSRFEGSTYVKTCRQVQHTHFCLNTQYKSCVLQPTSKKKNTSSWLLPRCVVLLQLTDEITLVTWMSGRWVFWRSWTSRWA